MRLRGLFTYFTIAVQSALEDADGGYAIRVALGEGSSLMGPALSAIVEGDQDRAISLLNAEIYNPDNSAARVATATAAKDFLSDGDISRATDIMATIATDDPVIRVSLEGISGGAFTEELNLDRGRATDGVTRAAAALDTFFTPFSAVEQQAYKLQAAQMTLSRSFSALTTAADELAYQPMMTFPVHGLPNDALHIYLTAADDLCPPMRDAIRSLIEEAGPDDVESALGPLLQLVDQRRWLVASELMADMAWCDQHGQVCTPAAVAVKAGCPTGDRWKVLPSWKELMQSPNVTNPDFRFPEGEWVATRVGASQWYRGRLYWDLTLSTTATAYCDNVTSLVHATFEMSQPNVTLDFFASRKKAVMALQLDGSYAVPYGRVLTTLSPELARGVAKRFGFGSTGVMRVPRSVEGNPSTVKSDNATLYSVADMVPYAKPGAWYDDHSSLMIEPARHIELFARNSDVCSLARASCVLGSASDLNGYGETCFVTLSQTFGPANPLVVPTTSARISSVTTLLDDSLAPRPWHLAPHLACESRCPASYSLVPSTPSKLYKPPTSPSLLALRVFTDISSGLIDCLVWLFLDYSKCGMDKNIADARFIRCAEVPDDTPAEMLPTWCSSLHASTPPPPFPPTSTLPPPLPSTSTLHVHPQLTSTFTTLSPSNSIPPIPPPPTHPMLLHPTIIQPTPSHNIPSHPTIISHAIPHRPTPYHTTPYHTTPHHTIPYHTIPYHTIPCHTIPYHTIPYHTIPYHTIPYHTIPYHTIPYHTIPYHTIPYHTIPYHTIPYHTIPYHTIPYHTIPYHTIPYHTIPCHAIPYHTIPYHTIPYHTIPYHTIPYHTIPYHTMPCHTIPYHTIPYHTIPYHTMPYHTIPYHTIPYHTIPYHTIPYHTIPYHTIPYHTPYHTIPYHTIPYHTIPYHTIPYYTIPYHTIPYHTIPYHTIPCHTIPY